MTHHYHHSCPLWVIYEYIPSHSGRTSQPVCCGCTTPAAWLGCLPVCCGCTACMARLSVCLYAVVVHLSACRSVLLYMGCFLACLLWLYSCMMARLSVCGCTPVFWFDYRLDPSTVLEPNDQRFHDRINKFWFDCWSTSFLFADHVMLNKAIGSAELRGTTGDEKVW